MKAKCPKCDWSMPIGKEYPRKHGKSINCPSCNSSLKYKQAVPQPVFTLLGGLLFIAIYNYNEFLVYAVILFFLMLLLIVLNLYLEKLEFTQTEATSLKE